MSRTDLFYQDVLGGLPPQLIHPLTEWEEVIAPNRRSRFTFPQKKNVLRILLIGETGSGKTSFMSLLLNLFQGNGPFELKEKHFIDAQSGLDLSQSQTTEARLYPFTTNDGVKVEILDTPGLADTRGIEKDKKHREKIYRATQELVTEIDGFMIIANGTVQRLTAATDYTLNILTNLFPRSIIDNVGIIFTHTGAGGGRMNFQMQSLPPELQNVQHWCLDNPLPLYKNYLDHKAAGNLSVTKAARQKRNLEDSYDDALESLNHWLEWLDERKEIPTTAIIELYQKSSHLESRLFEAITSMDKSSKLESKLQHTLNHLQTTAEQKDILTSLQEQLPPKIWVLKETPNHNTICITPDCHNNCHERCSLELGDTAIIGGSCMAFSTLGVPNKWLPFWDNTEVKCRYLDRCGHEARAHRYYQKIHQYIDNEAYTRIVENLRTTTTEQYERERFKSRVGREIERVKQEIERSKREIHALVEELNSISLNPNYAGCIRSALEVLKIRKEQLVSRGDSGSELAEVNDGVKAFEAQLNLIRENEAGRVVETSAEAVDS